MPTLDLRLIGFDDINMFTEFSQDEQSMQNFAFADSDKNLTVKLVVHNWIRDILEDTGSTWIILLDSQKVGFIQYRFMDTSKTIIRVSCGLLPHYRGNGIMNCTLNSILNEELRALKNLVVIYGEIGRDDIKSERLFYHTGFKKLQNATHIDLVNKQKLEESIIQTWALYI